MRSVTLTIDLDALAYNFLKVREIAPGNKIFAVIKANAYGHDAVACAHRLSSLGDGFAVVTLGEALELRESGIEQPILILQGHRTQSDITQALAHNFSLVVHCEQQVELLAVNSEASSQSLPIWVKLDTGMGRLGLKNDDFDSIMRALNRLEYIEVKGLMTHFSCADEFDNPFTRIQMDRYNESTKSYDLDSSMANSAAILAWPDAHQGWLRPGIMLYGVNPLWPIEIPELRPVMCVEAPVIAIHRMRAGETIGYGNTYACTHDCEVAVVAIGYGDGYPRHVGVDATVLIGSVECRILGRVSMDSMVVMLPQRHSCELFDKAVLWGKRGLSVERVAAFANTLSYELLCQIKGRKIFL